MGKNLEMLIEKAKKVAMSSEEREKQRRSFAYGNTHFENTDITRQIIDEQAEIISKRKE